MVPLLGKFIRFSNTSYYMCSVLIFPGTEKIRKDCKIVEPEGAFDASCFNLQIFDAQNNNEDLVLNIGLDEELFNVHHTA